MLEEEYCAVNGVPPLGSGTVPKKRTRYSNRIFPRLIEKFQLWFHKGIPPSVDYRGLGGQNPLLLEAFRRLMAADGRKQELDDRRRKNQWAADAAATRAQGGDG